MTLKKRFVQFMLSMADVESIDVLLHESAPVGLKIADFLAYGRRAIVEVKSIERNPARKIQSFLDGLAQNGCLLNAEDVTLTELLRALPDGQALFDELLARVTKVFDDLIARADDQVRHTRKIFNIPDAIGVVAILNEDATLLYPDISAVRIFEVLRKTRDGQLRYTENHVVIYISEAHIIHDRAEVRRFPTSTVYSDIGNATPFATTVAEELSQKWAAFNDAGYMGSYERWDYFRSRNPVEPFVVVRKPAKSGE
jgi:hypothetical protein